MVNTTPGASDSDESLSASVPVTEQVISTYNASTSTEQAVTPACAAPSYLDRLKLVLTQGPNRISLLGILIASLGLLWAVESYQASTYANVLALQEACRVHPVCPVLPSYVCTLEMLMSI
jgi:hypothetical protein